MDDLFAPRMSTHLVRQARAITSNFKPLSSFLRLIILHGPVSYCQIEACLDAVVNDGHTWRNDGEDDTTRLFHCIVTS